MSLLTRTSLSRPLQIAEVKSSTGGIVGITFCPGKCARSLFGPAWQRDLAIDLDAIKAWGAECVVTLMEHHEFELLQVRRLGDEVRARGMRWLHLPIVDVNVPSAEFEAEWTMVVDDLVSALGRGGKVLVHCKGGLGRAGTVASLLLIETGEAPAAAIRKVRAVRPGALETPAQERYAMNYKPHNGPAA
jgi:ADP-ribosyl-[dinitrogen reductase] hydrolase